jgi:hypothetical protein
MDNSTTNPYIITKLSDNILFEALFVMIGEIRTALPTLRPFYALDGTHTRSRYNLTLLIAVGIDAEDRILLLAFALVPGENKTWWGWFCGHLVQAFDDALPPQYGIISDRDKGLYRLWIQSFLVHIMQCVASILLRINTRDLAKSIKLVSGK